MKKQKLEKYTPAPDSLLEQARKETAVAAAAPALAGTATDLAVIGAGRTSVLGQNLDRAGDTVSGRATVDPAGYLTEMAGVHINSESEISDIKKARLLLNSVTTTNPKHAPGWIAAARLEEVAGKMSVARSLAAEGCRRCPKEEDVWLEAARLYPLDRAKRVLAQAVIHVPKSVKVWLQASALETEVKRKRRVLRKALEVIPPQRATVARSGGTGGCRGCAHSDSHAPWSVFRTTRSSGLHWQNSSRTSAPARC